MWRLDLCTQGLGLRANRRLFAVLFFFDELDWLVGLTVEAGDRPHRRALSAGAPDEAGQEVAHPATSPR
jgi:hypothetical protein